MSSAQVSNQLELLQKECSLLPYASQYPKWIHFISICSSADAQLEALTRFLALFPFNYEQWRMFVDLKSHIDPYKAGDAYKLALSRCPKSLELWKDYLQWAKGSEQYKKELERAIAEIGVDSSSLELFRQFNTLINDDNRYDFYKKALLRPLIGLEELLVEGLRWLDGLSEQQVMKIYNKELRAPIAQNSRTEILTFLRTSLTSTLTKTVQYRDRRMALQKKINKVYYNGDNSETDRKLWRELIELERAHGVTDSVCFTYERALMAESQWIELWEEAMHYLEHQANKYAKALSILRSNRQFFVNLSPELFFYWCDLEERENADTARSMYLQFCVSHPSLESYERLIQLQIREKQWKAAKELYDKLLVLYQQEHDVLCYVVLEYVNFVIQYYRDFDFSKQLIKGYFEYLPFNEGLYFGYIEFLKHYENKDGYYDELMTVILDGLVKAKKSCKDGRIGQIIKSVKFALRSALTSIYLIKHSERRISELEDRVDKIVNSESHPENTMEISAH